MHAILLRAAIERANDLLLMKLRSAPIAREIDWGGTRKCAAGMKSRRGLQTELEKIGRNCTIQGARVLEALPGEASEVRLCSFWGDVPVEIRPQPEAR
ncbi:MAG: hypothetical protein ABSF26_12120 [Thermoguttaceae bacterium]